MGFNHRRIERILARRRHGRSARKAQNFLLGARRTDRLEKVAPRRAWPGALESVFSRFRRDQKRRSVETFIAWARGKMADKRICTFLINNAGGAHGQDSVAGGQRTRIGRRDDSKRTCSASLRVTRAGAAVRCARTRARRHHQPIGRLPGHTATKAARCIARPSRLSCKSPAHCEWN